MKLLALSAWLACCAVMVEPDFAGIAAGGEQ